MQPGFSNADKKLATMKEFSLDPTSNVFKKRVERNAVNPNKVGDLPRYPYTL